MLGRSEDPGLGTGFGDPPAGATDASAAGASASCCGSAEGASSLPSDLRAAAKISATDIFFLSAIDPLDSGKFPGGASFGCQHNHHNSPRCNAGGGLNCRRNRNLQLHCDNFHNVSCLGVSLLHPIVNRLCRPQPAELAQRRLAVRRLECRPGADRLRMAFLLDRQDRPRSASQVYTNHAEPRRCASLQINRFRPFVSNCESCDSAHRGPPIANFRCGHAAPRRCVIPHDLATSSRFPIALSLDIHRLSELLRVDRGTIDAHGGYVTRRCALRITVGMVGRIGRDRQRRANESRQP